MESFEEQPDEGPPMLEQSEGQNMSGQGEQQEQPDSYQFANVEQQEQAVQQNEGLLEGDEEEGPFQEGEEEPRMEEEAEQNNEIQEAKMQQEMVQQQEVTRDNEEIERNNNEQNLEDQELTQDPTQEETLEEPQERSFLEGNKRSSKQGSPRFLSFQQGSISGMSPYNGIASIRTPEILNLNKMTAEEIADILEIQRLKELEKAANSLKNTLPRTGRCPVCTLLPPCKHYNSSDDIPAVKKMKQEEARAREQRRNSPRVYKRRKKSEENLEMTEAQAKIMKKFTRALTNQKQKYQDTEESGSAFPGIFSPSVKPNTLLHQQQQLANPSERSSSPKSMLPPVMAQSHYSQIKMVNTRGHGGTRGSAANQSMYSHHNKTASLQGSVASEGRGYRGGKGQRGASEEVMIRVKGKHGVYRTQKGDVNQTMLEEQETEMRKRELRKANERLKVLEKLEKYREEKLRKQYEQIEEQKKKEQEDYLKKMKKEEARRKYIEKQKKLLEVHHKQKEEKEKYERERQIKEIEKQRFMEQRRQMYFAEQKQKINEYKVKKQIIDDFLRANQIYTIEDLRQRGQVFLPESVFRRQQQEQYDQQQYYYQNQRPQMPAGYEGQQEMPQGMGWVAYPIAEKDSEQKDSLDMLEGEAPVPLDLGDNPPAEAEDAQARMPAAETAPLEEAEQATAE